MFFCNGDGGWGEGGHYREYRRQEPCRGVWGYPPPENFQVWTLFSALAGDMSPKNRP